MAQDKKISELDTSGTIVGTEVFPLVQSGTTFKSTINAIYTFFETTFKAAVLTLTNKIVQKRVSTTTFSATIDPNVADFDMYVQTAASGGITVNAPVGTPLNGQSLEFLLLDNGVGRTITWDGSYVDLTGSLPTTTTATKLSYIKFLYTTTTNKFICVIAITQP